MKSIKCQNCGLVNFQGQNSCRRCNKILSEQNEFSSTKRENIYSDDSIDLTQENLKFVYQILGFGVLCSVLPWILTFVFGILSAKIVWASIIGGPTFVVVGIGIIASPPKSKLNAEENKPRNGVLIVIGLLLGLIEAYFYNKAIGYW